MAEVHIFDFDGTIFYSPAPSRAALASLVPPVPAPSVVSHSADQPPATVFSAEDAAQQELEQAINKLYGGLQNPVSSGGYGWFQSLHTMSPPAVPERPAEEQWFVTPILAHMRAIVRHRESLMQSGRPKQKLPLLYVLTGRDVKYYDRIWTLLQQVGLDKEVEDVILKPYEVSGTVTYKLNTFFRVIQYHRSSRVFYYEDRVEQGGRLLEGMRALERILFYPTHTGSGGAAEHVGVVTFDVTPSVSASAAAALALETPQPTFVLRSSTVSHEHKTKEAEADQLTTESGAHTELTAALAASPYVLLRDACYPISWQGTFYGADDSGAATAEKAQRQGQRWAQGTIAFWNEKTRSGRGGRGAGSPVGATRGGRAGTNTASPTAGFDARTLHESIRFSVGPPFIFTMVLVPPALSLRSERMLTTAQLEALVDLLAEEKAK